MTEEVKLTSLMPRLTAHAELEMQEVQSLAAESDATQQKGDYGAAIQAARALLVRLIKSIAQELRRPPGEPLAAFRARQFAPRSFRKSCGFLRQGRFLDEQEQTDVERTCAATVTPDVDSGVSLETWSRLARQRVFTTVARIAARYDKWQTGCSCPADSPTEITTFDSAGGKPPYKRAICKVCRCPRGPAAYVVDKPHEAGRPQLSETVCEVLRGLGKRELLTVCVRSMERLCDLAAT